MPPTEGGAVPAEAGALPGGPLVVDGDAGNNNFTAVFEAPLGERITAVSSAVDCAVTWDDKANTFGGTCAVPLMSIMVDSDSTKTDHFQQWATNKKIEPSACKFEAKFDGVKPAGPLTAGVPVKFATDVPFTICGRARVDGGREHVEGTALLFPPERSMVKTVRVRAQIDGFNRDRYHIGPAYTDGWLARVQKLAPVVAEEGSISLSLFAKPKE
jgi:hypothetical protein